jgi:hypothetical protein
LQWLAGNSACFADPIVLLLVAYSNVSKIILFEGLPDRLSLRLNEKNNFPRG